MTKEIPDEKLKEVTGGTEEPIDLNNTGGTGGSSDDDCVHGKHDPCKSHKTHGDH